MTKERRPGSRTLARERALQALYEVDLASADPIDALSHAWKSEEGSSDPAALAFSEKLVRGVVDGREELDRVIEAHSHNWRVDRMSKVDRNVLRLAVWELLHELDTPRRVVLNEAIELAKRFGTEESGAFINGVLDKIPTKAPEGAAR